MRSVVCGVRLGGVVLLIALSAAVVPLMAQIQIPGAGENSSDWVDVEMVQSHEAVPAGSSLQIGFEVQIDEGWMVHSNSPSYTFYTPTRLIIENMPGVTVQSVQYPQGLDRAVSYAGSPFNVYEGTFYILVDMEINEQLAARELYLQMMLNFQACDQELCIPPAGVPFRIPITILAPDDDPVPMNRERLEQMAEVLNSAGLTFSWRPWTVLGILLIIGWMVAIRIRRRSGDRSS